MEQFVTYILYCQKIDRCYVGQLERQEERKQFIKNKYRVLLTRGREGLIIFIPQGSESDHTRPSKNYDTTYEYLKRIGIKEL